MFVREKSIKSVLQSYHPASRLCIETGGDHSSFEEQFQAFRGGLGGTSKATRVPYKAFIELCQDRAGFTL